VKNTTQSGALVLWTAWILTGAAAFGPSQQFLFGPIFRVLGVQHLPRVLEGFLAISWFLLYAFGKPICVLLAISFLIVAAKSDIPAKRKAITLAVMTLTAGALLYWIDIVKHSW
jgi:hypothetical protein